MTDTDEPKKPESEDAEFVADDPSIEHLVDLLGPYVQHFVERNTEASLSRFRWRTIVYGAPLTAAAIYGVLYLLHQDLGGPMIDTLGQYLGYYLGGFGTAALIGKLRD